METITAVEVKIYVACLASYNSGILYGRWIDANQSAEEIHAEIKEMLKESSIIGAEEWAIHDYEGFGDISLSEYEDIETVAELAELIETHGEAFGAFIGHVGISEKDRFEDAYVGIWESEVDFATELFDETMEVKENIAFYIDYESFSRDLFITDYFSVQAQGCKVYVFRNM